MLRIAISGGAGRAGLVDWAQRLGPVEWALVRERSLNAGELVRACREVRAAVAAGTRVLGAGGRVDVALAAGLDGVHLGGAPGELRVGQVRRLFPEASVTVSCHTLAEVRLAREQGASAVLFAPVFGKSVGGVEVVAGVGLEALAAACSLAGAMPVFALGGVTAENAEACVRAGAAGVAGIGMFAGSRPPVSPAGGG